MSDVIPNSTALERSLVAAFNDGGDLSLVAASAVRPETIPAALVPWAAWGQSVDAWSDDWPTELKRSSVRNSFKFHRLKGTMAGLRMAAAMGDCSIVRAVNPPSKTFAAPAMTEAERLSFLKRYPELRILPYRGRGARPKLPGDRRWFGLFGNRDFVGSAQVIASSAAARLSPRAMIVDRGAVQSATTFVRQWDWRIKSYSQDVEVRRPSTRRNGTFFGGFVRFIANSGARERIFSVKTSQFVLTPDNEVVALRAVVPSLEPISVYAEDAVERGIRRGAFLGSAYTSGGKTYSFFPDTTAGDRIFKRTYLFDKNRTLESRGRSVHIGATRLSMPAFMSELLTECKSVRHRWVTGKFLTGHVVGSDKAKLQNVLRLMRISRRASVKVLVNTKTIDVAKAGAVYKAGAIVAGQLTKVE